MSLCKKIVCLGIKKDLNKNLPSVIFFCAYRLVSSAIIVYICRSNKALKKCSGLIFCIGSSMHWRKPEYGAIAGPVSTSDQHHPIS